MGGEVSERYLPQVLVVYGKSERFYADVLVKSGYTFWLYPRMSLRSQGDKDHEPYLRVGPESCGQLAGSILDTKELLDKPQVFTPGSTAVRANVFPTNSDNEVSVWSYAESCSGRTAIVQ